MNRFFAAVFLLISAAFVLKGLRAEEPCGSTSAPSGSQEMPTTPSSAPPTAEPSTTQGQGRLTMEPKSGGRSSSPFGESGEISKGQKKVDRAKNKSDASEKKLEETRNKRLAKEDQKAKAAEEMRDKMKRWRKAAEDAAKKGAHGSDPNVKRAASDYRQATHTYDQLTVDVKKLIAAEDKAIEKAVEAREGFKKAEDDLKKEKALQKGLEETFTPAPSSR